MAGILRFKNEEGKWVEVTALVSKGVSITKITRVGRTGDEVTGYIDTYRIDFSDNTSTTYTVNNGVRGVQGIQGPTNEIVVESVTTLNAGNDATVTATFDSASNKTKLKFGIPKGSTTVVYKDWGEEE